MARELSYRHDVRADTRDPIGCSKTDAHAVNICTSAATASGNRWRTPSSRASQIKVKQ